MTNAPELYKFGTLNKFHALYPSITPPLLEELRKRSIAAKAHAYCPYSNFRVGASILTTDGDYVEGANVENAAFPVGLCAERVAIATAVFAFNFWERQQRAESQKNFVALAIATNCEMPASPCGMCRQL